MTACKIQSSFNDSITSFSVSTVSLGKETLEGKILADFYIDANLKYKILIFKYFIYNHLSVTLIFHYIAIVHNYYNCRHKRFAH